MLKVRNPIFVVGYPKSGTSYLSGLLSSHSKLDLIERAFFDGRASDETNCFFEFQDRVVEIFKTYQQNLSEGHKIVEKTPMHMTKLVQIKEAFPDAYIIYIQRDPRGVINSALRYDDPDFMLYNYNVEQLVDHYMESYRTYCRDRYLVDYEVTYEELLDNVSLFEDILEQLGVNIGEALSCVQQNHKVGRTFRRGEPKSWMFELNHDARLYIEDRLDEIISEWGY